MTRLFWTHLAPTAFPSAAGPDAIANAVRITQATDPSTSGIDLRKQRTISPTRIQLGGAIWTTACLGRDHKDAVRTLPLIIWRGLRPIAFGANPQQD